MEEQNILNNRKRIDNRMVKENSKKKKQTLLISIIEKKYLKKGKVGEKILNCIWLEVKSQ